MINDELKFDSATMERIILANIIKDKSFYLKVGKYLRTDKSKDKNHFNDHKLQWILNTCALYYDKYERLPSLETMKILIEGSQKLKEDPLLAKATRNAAEEIFNKDLSSVELDYIRDETVRFVKTKRAVEATYLNQIDIANGKFDNLNNRMQEAVNINLDKDFGISLADTGAVYDLLQQTEADSGLTYSTPNLDRILGSPRGGELTVFCGTPGVGKTIWLGNVAVENMKLGKKGVFFSLEVDKRRLAKRLYSSLLLKAGCDILNMSKEQIDEFFKGFNGGDIRIKNYPAHTACCNDFANYLMDLYTIEGFKADFIIIDYILITAANSLRRGDDNSYGYNKAVAEEMRNLAMQFDVPVFSAAQINRNGQGDKGGTKAIVTSKDLAESRGILDTCENLLIIQQTDAEKKLAEKDGIAEQRLYIDKNRNGKSSDILNFTLDYNTMSVRDGKKDRKI